MEWEKSGQRPVRLRYQVPLIGAKAPRNFFNIAIDPESGNLTYDRVLGQGEGVHLPYKLYAPPWKPQSSKIGLNSYGYLLGVHDHFVTSLHYMVQCVYTFFTRRRSHTATSIATDVSRTHQARYQWHI